MYTFELILFTIRLVNFVLMVIAILTNNSSMLYATVNIWCVLLVIRVIVALFKRFKRKFNKKDKSLDMQLKIQQVMEITEEQVDNLVGLLEKLDNLSDIIESNGSYYEAQNKYLEIKQMIDNLNDEQLREHQKLLILHALSALESDMVKLELKR